MDVMSLVWKNASGNSDLQVRLLHILQIVYVYPSIHMGMLYSVAHSSAVTFIYQHKKVNIREAMPEKGSEATTRVHSSHRG